MYDSTPDYYYRIMLTSNKFIWQAGKEYIYRFIDRCMGESQEI